MMNEKNNNPEGIRKTILVVDDEPDIIIYLTSLLEKNGYSVIQARTAEEALKVLPISTPDLICLDIKLPKKSGIAFYQQVKKDEAYKAIPTIFISAFGMARDFDSQRFSKLTSDESVPEPEAHFEKPVQVDKLIEAIKDILG